PRRSRRAAWQIRSQGDRPPDCRQARAWPIPLPRSGHARRDRPLSRRRRSGPFPAARFPSLADLVARPPLSTRRISQSAPGLCELVLGLVHLWQRRTTHHRRSAPRRARDADALKGLTRSARAAKLGNWGGSAFSRILFEKSGAVCATDRDGISAPTISQCKLIACSRHVLRLPVAAVDPFSAISPARIVIRSSKPPAKFDCA